MERVKETAERKFSWKVPVFGVILVRIQYERGKMQTRITLNKDTFYSEYEEQLLNIITHPSPRYEKKILE